MERDDKGLILPLNLVVKAGRYDGLYHSILKAFLKHMYQG